MNEPSVNASTGARDRQDADALVSWSALAEPADVGAAWLVATLGPRAALDWVRLVAENSVEATMALAAYAPPAQVDEAVRLSEKWVARLDVADPHHHRDRAQRCGARVVTRAAPEWPTCLDDLGPVAPFALWVRGTGNLAQLMSTAIAMVGARSATAYGEHATASIAGELADRGATIVSGGAYGIDAAAHRTALACGDATVAVMAGGVDRLYPAGNTDLLERILDGGVALSEVPPGYAPHRARFLSRNRLIATARATVVVEAAVRSGALSTARHAAAMLRPVAAVPGPITSASSAGCHGLVRDGIAALVTSGREVLELAEPLGSVGAPTGAAGQPAAKGGPRHGSPGSLAGPARAQPQVNFSDSMQRQAYGAISPRGSAVASIARESGLTLEQARASLGGLEIAGLAGQAAGVWWRQKSGK